MATISIAILILQTVGSQILFKGSKLTCKDWAEAANYYIDLGEAQACQELSSNGGRPSARANVRKCLICRILFVGRHGPLRAPSLGDLSLPSMPLSSWPEFPLLQQDGVWLLFDENYRPGSKAERASDYIDYCRKDGAFRTEKIPMPRRSQAVDALKTLQGTKRWRAIPWSDSDLHSSYTYDRSWTIEQMRSQTHFDDSPR